jgi:hypothetical protein
MIDMVVISLVGGWKAAMDELYVQRSIAWFD